MDIHQARTEAVHKEIMVKMVVHQERMGSNVNAWQKEEMACQENMEVCLGSKEPKSLEEKKSVVVHEEVPKKRLQ
jgi:hypothetical protein